MKAIIAVVLGCLLLSGAASANDLQTGYIAGQLKAITGAPLAGGMVFFFNAAAGPPPAPDKYWRVPDEIGFLDDNGNFKSRVAVGNYFIGAVRRSSGKDPGPPLDGDLFLVDRDGSGTPRSHTVKKDETTEIGTIAGAVPYRSEPGKVKSGITAIEGRVTDAEGKPVAGALVFAFVGPSMANRPLFVSERSGKDGKYLLRVSGSGSYYLKLRDVYGGGTPRVGALIGGYGGETPIPVKTQSGTVVTGMDIKAARFAGKGQKPE